MPPFMFSSPLVVVLPSISLFKIILKPPFYWRDSFHLNKTSSKLKMPAACSNRWNQTQVPVAWIPAPAWIQVEQTGGDWLTISEWHAVQHLWLAPYIHPTPSHRPLTDTAGGIVLERRSMQAKVKATHKKTPDCLENMMDWVHGSKWKTHSMV